MVQLLLWLASVMNFLCFWGINKKISRTRYQPWSLNEEWIMNKYVGKTQKNDKRMKDNAGKNKLILWIIGYPAVKEKKVCFLKLNYGKIVLLQPKITNHSLSQGSLQPVSVHHTLSLSLLSSKKLFIYKPKYCLSRRLFPPARHLCCHLYCLACCLAPCLFSSGPWQRLSAKRLSETKLLTRYVPYCKCHLVI